MLTEDEVEALESILFDPEYGDHALDVFGLHGAVTAAVVSPETLDMNRVFAVATGQTPETVSSVPEVFSRLVTCMAQELRQLLSRAIQRSCPNPKMRNQRRKPWRTGAPASRMYSFLKRINGWSRTRSRLVSSSPHTDALQSV